MSKIFHTKFFDDASFCAFINIVMYLQANGVKFEHSNQEIIAEYFDFFGICTDESLEEVIEHYLKPEGNGSQISECFDGGFNEDEYSLEEDLSENVGYTLTFFYEVLRLVKKSSMDESDADKLLDRVMYALDLDDEDVEEYYEMVDDEIAMLKQIDKLTKAHQKKVKHMFDFDDDTAEKRLKF